ncbi:hypothetical protein FITA111629_05400 [Filibacter tadaridae]|uniref:Lipoprotein n=1 Tax=Filibacter tadaridae TaxID=2483811 RepID=A0A3P5WX41_9BACL|nr:hypothetical protein [Filibacter tadaridae]VDC19443.1 hypothetical protein FILTAD_00380 [Filibacter tadaridae]
MLKKVIPIIFISGLVLTACGNDDAVPDNNETPMENMDDREKDWTPDADNKRGGADLDGIEEGQDNNGTEEGIINDNNGVNNGVINDDSDTMNGGTTNNGTDDGIIDENTTTPNESGNDTDMDQKDKNGNNR